MNTPVIQVQRLSKEYQLGSAERRYSRLGDQVIHTLGAPLRRAKRLLRLQANNDTETALWALKDISFQVQPGEVVGIIGRNGAGKSTLLKVLSQITDPTSGEATIYGRVGSLLEVGTGFHPELTGRENTYLNGAILGMKKFEIDRKFDEIVAFAEIEKFLDTPVKHYSSGMYVRLAFAVAAHLEPEILMIDEVLAVGDIAFQRKCLGKMSSVAGEGRTILFVSHNMGIMQKLCQRGILLQNGQMVADTSMAEAADIYLRTLEAAESQPIEERTDRRGRGLVQLTAVDILDQDGLPTSPRTGQPVRFVFHVSGTMPAISCVFTVFNQIGQRITAFKSDAPGPADQYDPAIGHKFVCDIEPLLLVAGRYRIDVLIRGGGERQDHVQAAAVFDVQEGLLDGRVVKPFQEISVSMPHRWTLPFKD
ncbi:MAG: ABC transporter ATP-binding protein [Ardenticatenaceae bacterium]|nr:ABC transporter ATP-binding protein [Ardenticatenaceae bacterium]